MTVSARAYVAFFLERTDLTPGRIRLRVPSQRANQEYFSRLRETSESIASVLRVEITPNTASILLIHDGDGHEVLTKFCEVNRVSLCRREALSMEEQRGGLPQFTQKERATIRFLGYTALSVVQVMRGEILAAGSALAVEAEGYWRRLSKENEP